MNISLKKDEMLEIMCLIESRLYKINEIGMKRETTEDRKDYFAYYERDINELNNILDKLEDKYRGRK
jgi:hypothetical protein